MKWIAMLTAAAAVLLLASAGSALAAEVEVKLLNKGSEGGTMAFQPAYVRVAPGDTVKFLVADSSYDAEAVKDMLPPVAIPLTAAGGKDLTVRFEQEGVYGMKCLPHRGICMVVMVAVTAHDDHTKGELQAVKTRKISSHIDAAGRTALR
jgi:pseudoazurin